VARQQNHMGADKKHRPEYAAFLKEFTETFGKPREPAYFGNWKDIGAYNP